jgi:hypothetical protein
VEKLMGVKRKVWRVKGREQFELFVERRSEEKATKAKNGKWFVDPDPQGIYIGDQPLEKYLQDLYGKQSPIELRRILRSLDWTAFEDAYARRGRSAYAPVDDELDSVRSHAGPNFFEKLGKVVQDGRWSDVALRRSLARPFEYRPVHPAARQDVDRRVHGTVDGQVGEIHRTS